MRTAIPIGAGAAAAGALAWGHFEAGWVRLETLDCPLPRLPRELAGLRVAHLSDFHLGMPSRGTCAVERAVDWVAERRPDLTLISGDLLSRRSGEPRLRQLLQRLLSSHCYAVLGNHDFAETKDPFSTRSPVGDLWPATLLLDEGEIRTIRGRRVQIVGVDPRTYRRGASQPLWPTLQLTLPTATRVRYPSIDLNRNRSASEYASKLRESEISDRRRSIALRM